MVDDDVVERMRKEIDDAETFANILAHVVFPTPLGPQNR